MNGMRRLRRMNEKKEPIERRQIIFRVNIQKNFIRLFERIFVIEEKIRLFLLWQRCCLQQSVTLFFPCTK